MSKIIPILFIGILLSACGGMPADNSMPDSVGTPTSSVSNSACGQPSNWTIQYHRNGGFAGFDEFMTLDNGGKLTVKNERPPTDLQKTLSDDQVKAITELLVQACPFETTPDKGTCADCFIYDLDIQMDSRDYSIQASDVTLSKDLQPLVSELSQLLRDAKQ